MSGLDNGKGSRRCQAFRARLLFVVVVSLGFAPAGAVAVAAAGDTSELPDAGARSDGQETRGREEIPVAPVDSLRTGPGQQIDFTGTPPPPPRDETLPVVSAGAGQRRPLPLYDGRPPALGTPGETFVWGPRVLLFPAHVVAEYGLRKPLVAAITFGEEHYLWPRVYRFFTWNDGRAGVYPIFDVDFGLKATAGATLFAREFVASANDFHASASLANEGVMNLRVRDHLSLWRHRQGGVYLHATWVRRPDGVYFGPGGITITRQADLTYFFYDERAAEVGVDGNLGGMSRIAIECGVRDLGFGTDTRSPDRRSIATNFGGPTGPPLPPGFNGYAVLRPRIALVLDSRDPDFEHPTGTGVRLETEATYGRSLSDSAFAFARWGATLAGFWDVSGVNHVLAAEIALRFVEPIAGGPIPFTELPSLGGRELMRGFLEGRLRDDSALAATLQYRYPIWAYVDSEVFAGVGNVFAGHLRGFDPARLYLSCGGGLRTTFSREVSFVITVAAGTRRFDDPNFRAVDATRFMLGANHGF